MKTGTVSRPAKRDHVDTIIYEIDMLGYCLQRLRIGQWVDEKENNLYVEGFLLHYRNLIEFLASHGDGLRANRYAEWSPRALSTDEVKSIANAKAYKKYRPLISRYLSHCDKIRAEKDRGWKPDEMYAQIEPLVKNFLMLFPPLTLTRGAAFFSNARDASTATVTTYSLFSPDAIPSTSKKR